MKMQTPNQRQELYHSGEVTHEDNNSQLGLDINNVVDTSPIAKHDDFLIDDVPNFNPQRTSFSNQNLVQEDEIMDDVLAIYKKYNFQNFGGHKKAQSAFINKER